MRMWIRFSSLAIAVCIVAGCRGQASPGSGPPAPVSDPAGALHLTPGRYTFDLGRDVRVGESIRCFTKSGRAAGGGGIEPRGHGVASSTGFEETTSASGRVRITCPAHPGNA
jgi:hypothetical protein